MIHSFAIKQSGTRWRALGSCVFGPIDCSGATEQEAQTLAVLQIKGYQRSREAQSMVAARVTKTLEIIRRQAA